jgi:tryptophan synthase alpha chain
VTYTHTRIAKRFAALKAAGQKAFIPFITAGDPDLEIFAQLLAHLPKAGADLIEIGMPFSDPMADGPAIERANLRAFAAGITLRKILDAVATFRRHDHDTPIILMGYANPPQWPPPRGPNPPKALSAKSAPRRMCPPSFMAASKHRC